MIGLPINKPDGCSSCPCECEGFCGVLSIINGEPYSIDGKYAYQNGKTDPNCPIVELTE